MLTCYVPATGRLFLDWYRIVGVGDVNPPITNDTSIGNDRFVTLHGPDWPTAVTAGQQVYATIVDGVTGVFQKSITLDGSSSWQQ